MIDATHGVRSKNPVTEATRNASTTTRQAASDAFHGLFANSLALAAKPQAGSASVPNRKPAPFKTSQIETKQPATRGGGSTSPRGLHGIDVSKTPTQPARTNATSLVAIPMDQPVTPVTSREPARAAGATSPATVEPTLDNEITGLVQAMKDMGIDTSKLTITPRDLTNWGPNGTWVDHELQVSTQDGKSVYLAQDLLKGHYTIGACDVQHMLQSPYA
jgi:hypothetical protein